MESKEVIDVWRAEFENTNKSINTERHPEGDYIRDPVHYMWQGFLMAKRAQPVIEISSYDMHHYAPVRNMLEQLTAAGIQYKVRG